MRDAGMEQERLIGLISRESPVAGTGPATNPKGVGERSEAKILAAMVNAGFAVSLPFGNNQRYDMIIDTGKDLLRAQCKTGRLRSGSVRFNTCSANGFTYVKRNYAGQIEVFLVYCPGTDKVYMVPVEQCANRVTSLRLDPDPHKRSLRWAAGFEIVAP